MKNVKIKQLTGDSLTVNKEMCQYAFCPTPIDEEQTLEQKYQQDCYVTALVEDEIPVAVVTCIPLTQNVRGKICKSGGIADVATYPEARRKGYAKKLMYHHLKKMNENGQICSILYPFNEGFYEKFGYITFPQIMTARFPPNVLSPVLSMKIKGEVKRYLLKENFDIYLEILQKMQKKIHGFSIKPPSKLEQVKDQVKAWLAVAKRDGENKGFILYRVTKPFETFEIINFYYEDSSIKYLLLQYLAKHVNQFENIEMELKPDELIECWIPDSQVISQTKAFAASVMGRIISVENIEGMKGGKGRFSAQIVDSCCAWNNGLYEFSEKNGTLVVERTEKADCKLTIQGLSALVFGGYNPHDFILRSWTDASDKILEEMRKLFPRITPHIHSKF